MSASFRVTYDGAALENSEMDVRELAPALLAIGDLLDRSTVVLCGRRAKPGINVKGSFKTGSFGIEFVLNSNISDILFQLKDVFASDTASAIANAIEILGAIGLVSWNGKNGLFAVLRWIRSRPITKVEVKGEKATIYIGDESLEIEIAVLSLLRDIAVREAVEKVLVPLKTDGIDVFASGTDSQIDERITAEEGGWFVSPSVDDALLIDDTRRMAFSIVSLAFKEDNKWRLYDGAATIHASISDSDFLERVDNNLISFSKGDVLLCDVHVTQWQTKTGTRTEYDVIKVSEHRSAAKQIPLPGI